MPFSVMMTHLSEIERAMLKRLAEQEGPHFRHQTRDEVSLTVEEKINLAGDLLKRNPGEFLARHYRFLSWPEDAECFRDLWDNYTVRYYLKEVVGISSPPSTSADAEIAKVECAAHRRRRKLHVKNRRLVALRRMEAEAKADPTEGFFSHEQMRERAPELWEHMVGRYLTNTDRRALLGHQYESFSGMLLSQLLNTEQRLNIRPENLEEDSDDSEEGTESNRDRRKSQKGRVIAEQERSREEFRELMHSHFLAGLDKEFDYEFATAVLKTATKTGLTNAWSDCIYPAKCIHLPLRCSFETRKGIVAPLVIVSACRKGTISAIDNDSALDDEMEELAHDAEDVYFDSESPSAAPSDDHSNLTLSADCIGDHTLPH